MLTIHGLDHLAYDLARSSLLVHFHRTDIPIIYANRVGNMQPERGTQKCKKSLSVVGEKKGMTLQYRNLYVHAK